MCREEAEKRIDPKAQAKEKWKQDLMQRNLNKTKASWKTQSTFYCYKSSLGWQRGTSDFCVAFPPALGSISLLEWGHPCREGPNVAIATLVESTLTNTYVCAHLLRGQN